MKQQKKFTTHIHHGKQKFTTHIHYETAEKSLQLTYVSVLHRLRNLEVKFNSLAIFQPDLEKTFGGTELK